MLLTLKPERAEMPGTVEHDLLIFENRLPANYRSKDPLTGINNLIRNPGLIRWSASSRAGTSKVGLIGFPMLGAAAIAAMFFSSAVAAQSTAFIMIVVAISAFTCFLYIDRRKNRNVVAIVDEYLDCLRVNQIEIGVELTQSKAVYDKRSTVSVAA